MAVAFTHVGKAYVTDLLNGGTPAQMEYIGWGAGTTTAAESQTALVTPSAEARATGTTTRVTTSQTNDTYQVVATLTSESTQNIAEAGLFNATTAGTMLIRADHAPIPLEDGDSIQYTFQLVVSQGA